MSFTEPRFESNRALWTLLDKKIGNRAFMKKEDLKKAADKSWSNIDNHQIKCFVESMPNAC